MHQNTSRINTKEEEKFITIINDTIEVMVIESTFNISGKYYVLISNNFVKRYGEHLYGLPKEVWYFYISNEENKGDARDFTQWLLDGVNGKVQLDQSGTDHFNKLNNKTQINEFFNNLTDELANAIPVESGRIYTNYRFQINTSGSQNLIILSIN
jgi:hypothetical protein